MTTVTLLLPRHHVEVLFNLARAAKHASEKGWHAPGCLFKSQLVNGVATPECSCGREQLRQAVEKVNATIPVHLLEAG